MKNALTLVRLGILAQVMMTGAFAQDDYQPLKVCVKTGDESGAGSRGGQIKIRLTIKNKTGQTEVAEGWLTRNNLSNGAYSCEQLGTYRYNVKLDPHVTNYRIENHGSNVLGDSWLCEFVGYTFDDGEFARERVILNKWINTGTWVEQDN